MARKRAAREGWLLPTLLVGLVVALLAGVTGLYLSRYGVGTLDNDAYSYIDEWRWIRAHGLFGPMRPLTGNTPKPLLVFLYGTLYDLGGNEAVCALCALVAGAAAGLMFAIGRRQHSGLAGALAAGLLAIQWPFLGGAVTANSSLFLLTLALGAYYALIVLPPGAARARWALGLLLLAGLCRPEGWLLYLLVWCVCFVTDASASREPISFRFLLPALFAPALTPLLDRALFGEWIYSARSFEYFYTHFPGAHAPSPLDGALVYAYTQTVNGIFSSAYPPMALVLLGGLGTLVMLSADRSQYGLGLLLGGCAAILAFHLNTFRAGFFPERFLLVPLAGAALLSAVGLAAPFGWAAAPTPDPVSGLRHLAFAPKNRGGESRRRRTVPASGWALCLVAVLGAAVYSFHAGRDAGRELMKQDTLNRYIARAAEACQNAPHHPARVLVDNAFYNPLRFHVPTDRAQFDRIIEELPPDPPAVQIGRYDVLCLGLETPRTTALIAAAAKRPAQWRVAHVASSLLKPLCLFVRKASL